MPKNNNTNDDNDNDNNNDITDDDDDDDDDDDNDENDDDDNDKGICGWNDSIVNTSIISSINTITVIILTMHQIGTLLFPRGMISNSVRNGLTNCP